MDKSNKLMRSLLAFVLVLAIVVGDVVVLADAVLTELESDKFVESEEVILEESDLTEEVEEKEEDQEIEEVKNPEDIKNTVNTEVIDNSNKKLDSDELEYTIKYVDRDSNEAIKEIKEVAEINEEVEIDAEDVEGYLLTSMSKIVDKVNEDNDEFIFYYVKATDRKRRSNYVFRYVVEEDGEYIDISPRFVGETYIGSNIIPLIENIPGYKYIGDEKLNLIIDKEGQNELVFIYRADNISLSTTLMNTFYDFNKPVEQRIDLIVTDRDGNTQSKNIEVGSERPGYVIKAEKFMDIILEGFFEDHFGETFPIYKYHYAYTNSVLGQKDVAPADNQKYDKLHVYKEADKKSGDILYSVNHTLDANWKNDYDQNKPYDYLLDSSVGYTSEESVITAKPYDYSESGIIKDETDFRIEIIEYDEVKGYREIVDGTKYGVLNSDGSVTVDIKDFLNDNVKSFRIVFEYKTEDGEEEVETIQHEIAKNIKVKAKEEQHGILNTKYRDMISGDFIEKDKNIEYKPSIVGNNIDMPSKEIKDYTAVYDRRDVDIVKSSDEETGLTEKETDLIFDYVKKGGETGGDEEATFLVEHISERDGKKVYLKETEVGETNIGSIVNRKKLDIGNYEFTKVMIDGNEIDLIEGLASMSVKKNKINENRLTFVYDYTGDEGEEPEKPEKTKLADYVVKYNEVDLSGEIIGKAKESDKFKHAENSEVEVAAKDITGYILMDKSPKVVKTNGHDEETAEIEFNYIKLDGMEENEGAYTIRHTTEVDEETIDIVARRVGISEDKSEITAESAFILGYKYTGFEVSNPEHEGTKSKATAEVKKGENVEIIFKYEKLGENEEQGKPEDGQEVIDPENPDKEIDPETGKPEIDPETGKELEKQIYTEHWVNHRDHKNNEIIVIKNEELIDHYKPGVVGVTIKHYSRTDIENYKYRKIFDYITLKSKKELKELELEKNELDLFYTAGKTEPGVAEYAKRYYVVEKEEESYTPKMGKLIVAEGITNPDWYEGTPNSPITEHAIDIKDYKLVSEKKVTKVLDQNQTVYYDFYYIKTDDGGETTEDKKGYYDVVAIDIESEEETIHRINGYTATLDRDNLNAYVDVEALDLTSLGIEEYTLSSKSPVQIKLTEENNKDNPKVVKFYYLKDNDSDDYSTFTIRYITEEVLEETVDGEKVEITVKKDIIDRRTAHGKIGSIIEASNKWFKGYKYMKSQSSNDGFKELDKNRAEIVISKNKDENVLEFVYEKLDDSEGTDPNKPGGEEEIDPEVKPGGDSGDVEEKDRYSYYRDFYYDIGSENKTELLSDTQKPIKTIVGVKITDKAPQFLTVEEKNGYEIATKNPNSIVINNVKTKAEPYKLEFGYTNGEDDTVDKGEGSYTVRYVQVNGKGDFIKDIVEPITIVDRAGTVIEVNSKDFTGYTLKNLVVEGEPLENVDSHRVIIESGKHKVYTFEYVAKEDPENPGPEVDPEEEPEVKQYTVEHFDFDSKEDIIKEEKRDVIEESEVRVYEYDDGSFNYYNKDGVNNNITQKLSDYYLVTATPVIIKIDDKDKFTAKMEHRAKTDRRRRSSYTVKDGIVNSDGKWEDLTNRRTVGETYLYSSMYPTTYKLGEAGEYESIKKRPLLVIGEDYNVLDIEYEKVKNEYGGTITTSFIDMKTNEEIERDKIVASELGDKTVKAPVIEGYKRVDKLEENVVVGENIARVFFGYVKGEEEIEDEEIEIPEEDNNDADVEESPEADLTEEKPSVNGGGGGGGGSSATEVKDKEVKSKELDKIKEKLEKDLNINEEEALEIDSKVTKDHTVSYLTGFSDGTIRPTENTTREEVATIIYRVLEEDYRKEVDTKDHAFTDVKDIWSEDFIATLSNAGIIEGFKDGSFKPKENMTRAEVATIIARLMDLELAEDNKFADTTDHWAAKYINAVAKEGWVDGYTDGSFRPNEKVTRAELVTMINNMLGRSDEEVEDVKEFKDLEDHRWYYDQIQLAIALD